MNILIVDDQPNLARVTAVAFKVLGCRAFTALTAAAARTILNTEKIDALFLDVHLGDESGLDFLSGVVAQPNPPPVILFTALDRDEIAEEARRCGAFDCLLKPFTIDDLRRQLTRIEQWRRDGKTAGETPASHETGSG